MVQTEMHHPYRPAAHCFIKCGRFEPFLIASTNVEVLAYKLLCSRVMHR